MNKKGFTLLEVLITATIMGIMGIGIMYFISQSNTIMNRSVKQSFAHTNAVRILNMVAKDIREGCIIKTNSGYGDHFFSVIYPDATQVDWGYAYETIDGVTVLRITRNGKKILFITPTGNTGSYDYVYLYANPKIEGKYMYAELQFNMQVDNEYLSINTTAYCRHDPKGYGFSPADYVNVY